MQNPERIELSITVPTEQTMLDAAVQHRTQAQAIIVTTIEESLGAQHLRTAINYKIKELTDRRMQATRPLDASKRSIMELFRAPLDMLEAAKLAIDGQLVAFEFSRQQAAREAQAKANQAAQDERIRLLKLADKAHANGKEQKAEEYQDRAAAVIANVVQTMAPRIAGTSFRERWSYRIIDASKINVQFFMPDEDRINDVVTAMGKDAESVVGGIEVFTVTSVASRRS